jgi:prepilin-type N-terminal cleavage/methylation domain-containing protein
VIVPENNHSAGFSLVEALVALAIAAILAVALTRFVAGTRANAALVDEMLEMAAMADTLLTDLPGEKPIRAGRIEGRSGTLAWRINVTPVAFRTLPLRVEKSAAVGERVSPLASKAKATEPSLFHVAITLQARSGRAYVVDTVRMGAGQ